MRRSYLEETDSADSRGGVLQMSSHSAQVVIFTNADRRRCVANPHDFREHLIDVLCALCEDAPQRNGHQNENSIALENGL